MEEEKEYKTLSKEEADELVLEHKPWCESIAKAVARAWSLDWQSDGLDGAAIEALIFCARRFQPERKIPFKGYARKRIHEAATEAARKSKGWDRGSGTAVRTERLAKQVSAELFDMFPELRSGHLPGMDDGEGSGPSGSRLAIQQLLVGASIIAAKQGLAAAAPDEMIDYKRMLKVLMQLEPVHQTLMWLLYWEGYSLRGIADHWQTDELNVIREHKVLLEYMQKSLAKGKAAAPPRVRPGLKDVSSIVKKDSPNGCFNELLQEV